MLNNYVLILIQIQIQPEDFVGPRMLKKYKAKQVKYTWRRILWQAGQKLHLL